MGMLNGARPDGVVLCDCILPEVGHEVNDRGSKGAGESIEVADMVSKSGVQGSRYGLVVLMKVTIEHVREGRDSRYWKGANRFWEYPAIWYRSRMCSCMHKSPLASSHRSSRRRSWRHCVGDGRLSQSWGRIPSRPLCIAHTRASSHHTSASAGGR